MKLFGNNISPYVRMCHITLLEESINFDFIETDTTASAKKSPTKKIPFLQDGEITLTDSGSIIKYIREKAGKPYLKSLHEFEAFLLINTSMDACINVFLLERDNITQEHSSYLKRQSARIESIFEVINEYTLAKSSPYTDIEIRLACYIDWALFRNRISIEKYGNLTEFMAGIKTYEPFINTALPES